MQSAIMLSVNGDGMIPVMIVSGVGVRELAHTTLKEQARIHGQDGRVIPRRDSQVGLCLSKSDGPTCVYHLSEDLIRTKRQRKREIHSGFPTDGLGERLRRTTRSRLGVIVNAKVVPLDRDFEPGAPFPPPDAPPRDDHLQIKAVAVGLVELQLARG